MKKNIKSYLLISASAIIFLSACGQASVKSEKIESTTKISIDSFSKVIDGKKTSLFVLKNKNNLSATFTNYGGRLISLMVPGKDGKQTDVVVGFKSVADYQKSTEPYFGATIGRYGNRIAKGHFKIDGKDYALFLNNGPNTLHGGKKGFQYVVWEGNQVDSQTVVFHYLAKDMEEGYPGNLDVKVTYKLTDDNSLDINYEATTDQKTIVNLTNHAFFNLNGEGNGNILDHQLQIFANRYTPVDSTLIPNGELAKVEGTPFDFRKAKTIGAAINESNTQLKFGKGYDHNFVLDQKNKNELFLAAKVWGNQSGIEMDIYTTEPGLQFYSGNFMQGKNTFKGGSKDDFRTALALETQHFPDSPNHPSFPSTLLNPGETYRSHTLYQFKF